MDSSACNQSTDAARRRLYGMAAIIRPGQQAIDEASWRASAVMYYVPGKGVFLYNRPTGALHHVSGPFVMEGITCIESDKVAYAMLQRYIQRCIDYVFALNTTVVVTPLFNSDESQTRASLAICEWAARRLSLSHRARTLFLCDPMPASHPQAPATPLPMKGKAVTVAGCSVVAATAVATNNPSSTASDIGGVGHAASMRFVDALRDDGSFLEQIA